MRTRILFVSLFFLTIGILLFYGGSVFAQGGDLVRVLRLSDAGLEQAHSVAFSADGKQLAVGGISGIYLFDISRASTPGLIETGTWVHNIAFVPGTDSLAAGLFDNTVKVWTGSGHQLLRTLNGPQGWVRSISFSRDGKLLAAASDDDTIHIWTADQASTILTLHQDLVGIRSVALSPDGQLVAAALGDKTVRVWTVPDGKLLYTLAGHGDWVRCVTFSPDGHILASSGFDMTIRLWDLSDGQLLRTLAGHTSSVLGLSFSPDGKILASGSTDSTVRLWRVEDGAPLQIMRGHTGFVYSVAFSPDGKILASGASDNTVRLWNVEAWLGMPAPKPLTGPVESTTKDCRLCHHRQGTTAPPRVLEVPCEACHAAGIGMSWCAAFPRSSTVGPLDTTYHAVNQVSGVPTGGNGLDILLASPGNGETLYVRGGFMAPEVIAGKVYAADPAQMRNVELSLQIIANGQPTQSLIAAPSPDGVFVFKTAINPNSPPPHLLKPSTRQCLQCHGDYEPEAGLPIGIVRLVVTATTPDGQRATDERWIRVDASRDTAMQVQVIDAQTGQLVPGVSVAASTTVYGWRDRFGTAISGGDGTALLALEASSQVPLTYRLSVPAQVVNGILYSDQPVDVKLSPGVSQPPTVTVHASAQRGAISGRLQPELHSGGLDIFAIQWPAGPAFRTPQGKQGSFSFADLPVGSYVITPDLVQLAQQGLSAAAQQIDLVPSPHATVAVPLANARSLVGEVTDNEGQPVPFAWVQVNGTGNAKPVDASSGHYVLAGLPDDASFVTVNAAGFYSQSLHISAGQKTISFRLVPDPAARRLSWGTGQVLMPPQSNAMITGSHITLQSGWLWGRGGHSEPLTIVVGSTEIAISAGEFALENAAGQSGWLYLRQGLADVLFSGNSAPVRLQAGQMIALTPSAEPLSMDETVVLSLHSTFAELPISERLEPTLTARLQNSLEKAGISTIQTITFITYFLSLVALIAMPVFVLFSIHRRRRAATSQEKH